MCGTAGTVQDLQWMVGMTELLVTEIQVSCKVYNYLESAGVPAFDRY